MNKLEFLNYLLEFEYWYLVILKILIRVNHFLKLEILIWRYRYTNRISTTLQSKKEIEKSQKLLAQKI